MPVCEVACRDAGWMIESAVLARSFRRRRSAKPRVPPSAVRRVAPPVAGRRSAERRHGVRGVAYPVRTERVWPHACGGQDLQTHVFSL